MVVTCAGWIQQDATAAHVQPAATAGIYPSSGAARDPGHVAPTDSTRGRGLWKVH